MPLSVSCSTKGRISKVVKPPEQAHIACDTSHGDVQEPAPPISKSVMDGTWSYGNRLADCMDPAGCEHACSQQ